MNLFKKYNLNLSKKNIESWLVYTPVFDIQENLNLWQFYWSVHKLIFAKPDIKNNLKSENLSVWMDSVGSLVEVWYSSKHIWTMDNFFRGKYSDSFFKVADRLFTLLNESLESYSPENIIRYEDLDEVIEAFPIVGTLPRDLQVSTIKRTLRIVVEKMISVPHKLRVQESYLARVYEGDFKSSSLGFGLVHLQRLKSEYSIFKNLQKRIYSHKIIVKGSGEGNEHAGEFQNMVDRIQSYFVFGLDGLKISSFGQSQSETMMKYNRKHLTLLNVFRFAARLVAMGYSKKARIDDDFSSIEKHEITKFIREFTDVFFEFHFSDTKDISEAPSIMERIYLEAKLFASSSYGFKRVPGDNSFGSLLPPEVPSSAPVMFTEAIEVISHYVSSFTVFEGVFEEMIGPDVCRAGMEQPIFGRASINKSCFKKNYMRFLRGRIDHLPNFAEFVRQYEARLQTVNTSHSQEELRDLYYETEEMISQLKFEGVLTKRRTLWAYGNIKDMFGDDYILLEGSQSERRKILDEFKFVRKMIRENLSARNSESAVESLFQNLDLLEGDYKGLESFMDALLKKAQVPELWSSRELSYADFNILGTFVHYMETFFAKYDQSSSFKGLIDGEEVEKVYLGVSYVLEQKISKRCVRQAFYDLLKNHEVPGAIDFFGVCRVDTPAVFKEDTGLSIDRLNFIKLINLITSSNQ